MTNLLLVALGGAIGASFRHVSGMVTLRLMGPGFPWGTFIVNVAGSLIMGLFIAWIAKRGGATSNELRLFFATGILGGFTTFSAFSLDVVNLLERGAMMQGVGYILASVLLSLGAIYIGLWFGRTFL